METPGHFGLPWASNPGQAEQAISQGHRVHRRQLSRNAWWDFVIASAEGVELAGTAAGLALGGGVLVTAAKKGGKWAVVKTIATAAASSAVEEKSDEVLRAAGVNNEVIQGVKLAGAVVNFVITRKRLAGPKADVKPQGAEVPPKPLRGPPASPDPTTNLPKPPEKPAQPKKPPKKPRREPRLPKKGTPERNKIEAARSRATEAARERELADIKSGGRGSGIWSDEELEEIRRTNAFPLDVRWHHDPTVANRPDLAGDSSVVRPVRGGTKGHLEAHGGDWRKPYLGEDLAEGDK